MLQACGHYYLDQGDQLQTGIGRENLLNFNAFTLADGSGQVKCLALPPATIDLSRAAYRNRGHVDELEKRRHSRLRQ